MDVLINYLFTGTLRLIGVGFDHTLNVTGPLAKIDDNIIGNLQDGIQTFPIDIITSGNTGTSLSLIVMLRKEVFGTPDDIWMTYNAGFVIGSDFSSIQGNILGIDNNYDPIDGVLLLTADELSSFASYDEASDYEEFVEDKGAPIDPKHINQILNPFDDKASYLAVERLSQDTNADLKRKIEKAVRFRSGSDYMGMINAVTRDLGLDRDKFIKIDFKQAVYGEYEEKPYPLITFDGVFLKLFYYNYTNGRKELDLEVNTKETSLNSMNDLAAYINENSVVFQCTVLRYALLPPFTLMHQSNLKKDRIALPQSTIIELKNTTVLRDSLTFSDTSTFVREVLSKQFISKHGDYYIDYENGVIHTMDMPNLGSHVEFKYLEFPFEMDGSPIAANNFGSRAMDREIFNQTIIQSDSDDPEDWTINSYPNQKGLSLISELIESSSNMWGK